MLLAVALFVAAAVVAGLLARRDERHRPIAWYCGVVAALDVLRLARAAALSPATGPREGWELLVRHLDCGAYLATLAALPAMAAALFLSQPHPEQEHAALHGGREAGHVVDEFHAWLIAGRRLTRKAIRHTAAPFVVAWLLLWIWLVGDYPELRGEGLMRVYHAVELAAVLLSGLSFARWLMSPRLLSDGLSAAVLSGLALIMASATAVLIPRFAGGTLLDSWPVLLWANTAMILAVLIVEGGELLRRRAEA